MTPSEASQCFNWIKKYGRDWVDNNRILQFPPLKFLETKEVDGNRFRKISDEAYKVAICAFYIVLQKYHLLTHTPKDKVKVLDNSYFAYGIFTITYYLKLHGLLTFQDTYYIVTDDGLEFLENFEELFYG